MDSEKVKESEKEGLLKELRERFQWCIDSDADNRSEGVEDLKFLTGDQWDPDAKARRQMEGRPCLTVNTLPPVLNQIINEQRQNRTTIKVHPVDNGADEETAEILQGLIRHIEYNSNAEAAYDTALDGAAAIGQGYFRLITDYESSDSFLQEIRFARIRNPFTVYFDPSSEQPDGSDARFVILSTKMSREAFKREYPKADAVDQYYATGQGDISANWCDKEWVRVAEYYRIEEKEATLVLLADGSTGWKDELIPGAEQFIVQERTSYKRKVMLYKCTGVDVLEKTEIPCYWIPVFPVWGTETDIDGTVIRSGIVRYAKDPVRMRNFWFTTATEEVALRPKVPYIGAEGQFEGHEANWRQANNRSFAYLEYKPVTVGGTMAPPPSRQAMADIPAGALQMATMMSDNIKAVTGIYDASLGARSNETSGRAIMARQREGDVANFHYVDNLRRAIRHAGRCLLSMIPRIYDTERVVRMLGDDDRVQTKTINQRLPVPQQDDKTGEVKEVLHNLSAGKYDVTISAGPSYTTKRQEAAEAMIQFGQSWPKLMEIAGDKVVRAMDWPGADDIAERIEKTIPPEIRQESDEENPAQTIDTPMGPLPLEQAPQVIGQMFQQFQAMQQRLQEVESGAMQEIERARIQAEATVIREQIQAASREEVAKIGAESRKDVEELKGMVQLLINSINMPALNAAAMDTQETEVQNAPDRGF